MLKKRGCRGWGGAWRAYVRLKTLGAKGTQSITAIAQAYKEEKEQKTETIAKATRMGAAATVAGRACPPKVGQSSFGAKSRNVKRRQVQDLRRAMAQITAGRDKEDGALALGHRLAFIGADVQTCLTVARSAMRSHMKDERARQATENEALASFAAGVGKEREAKLRKAFPNLPLDTLRAVPSPRGWCFECHPAQGESVANAVLWAHYTKEANSSSALKRHWEQCHETLLEANCPPIAATMPHLSGCCVAGRCLCTNEGKHLVKLRSALFDNMKKVFLAGSELRDRLIDGHFILKLDGLPDTDDFDALLEDDAFKEVWLHVGMLSLSPYQPTFMLLQKQLEPAGSAGSSARIQVKVSRGKHTCERPLYVVRNSRVVAHMHKAIRPHTPWSLEGTALSS